MALVLQTIDSDGIATLTLNDEANLNAMSDEMATEFAAAVQSLKGHKELRAVILTGAGKAFSAGGHLSMLEAKRAKTAEENRQGMLSFYTSFLCIRDLGVPLIAALNGAAVGAGHGGARRRAVGVWRLLRGGAAGGGARQPACD